jgi:DNA topoisomerase VI subunit A
MAANASDGDDKLVALERIQRFVEEMSNEFARHAAYPALQIARREVSNLKYVLPQDEHEGALQLRGDVVVKRDTCVARMVVVAAKALELRRKNEFRNQRDVYYQLKSTPEFALFPDIRLWYEAIADLASYFGRPRFGLGFLASPKGFFAGAVEVNIGGTWVRADKEMSINGDWLTGSPQIRNCGARYVVVVEDDGVFGALVQAGFHQHCVLLTGCGMPDIASRACLHRIATEFDTLPVYGVADCNPAGVGIVLAYKLGSANLGTESLLYAVPRLQWLCLRISQATHFDINGLHATGVVIRPRVV